ncbi:MAG: M61 family peptidase, partial [Candidatus Omnitrophica bacterium]|nr:M61 family peptidase [Candidatus Omnitrophota bacterium]
ELLWVYEGLTQYLGEVLTVRCGLLDQGEYLDRFARKVSELMSKKGRSWRSLADTAISSYLLRAHSP